MKTTYRLQLSTFCGYGISEGRRDDLTGGGLIRSHGGWAAVKQMRSAKMFEKSDERILGDGDFVEKVLSAAEEQMEKRIAVFRSKEIRKTIHNNEWYFAVVDVIAALTDSDKLRDYWYRMKKREAASSGIQLSTFCR